MNKQRRNQINKVQTKDSMLQLQPGDYLKNITIQEVNALQGAGMFQYSGQNCYLLNRDIPRLTLRPGVTIDKLVCLRHDQRGNLFQCAPPGCFSRQVQELYSNNRGGILPYMHNRYQDVWQSRWSKAARSPDRIRCRHIQVKKKFSLPGRFWMAVLHEDWEMPVPAADNFEAMAGRYCFYPAPMQRSLSQTQSYAVPGQPVYRDDNWESFDIDPIQGQLKLQFNTTILPDNLPVVLYLHPPVDPQKLHFSAWKHCFSPKKVSRERQYWQCLYKTAGITEIPGPTAIKKIFSGCNANISNTNCAWCSLDSYRQVHDRIRLFLNENIKFSVTLLQRRTTDESAGPLITLEELFPSVFGVQIILQDILPPAKSCGKSQHRCVYRGILYFDEIKAKGIIHLSLLTQYSTNSKRPGTVLGKNSLTGTFYHVQISA